MNAFHNLMTEAQSQWEEAQKHANLAQRFIGKADATGNEPGDTVCRAPLEAAQRQFDRAGQCVRRASDALSKALAIRPDIELTAKGLAAIDHAREGAPPRQAPVDGTPPVERSNVTPIPIRRHPLPGSLDHDPGPSAA